MATVQTSAPAVEPITLADAKAFLRIDTADEDGLILSLIMTARLQIEVALGLALIQQQWSCFYDRWPHAHDMGGAPIQPPSLEFTIPNPRARLYQTAGTITLPINPVRSVDAIRVYADDGTFALLTLDAFTIDLVSRPARVTPRMLGAIPSPGRSLNGIEIAITAGFATDAASIPANIRQALLLLVAHWYEHRDPSEIGRPETQIPATVSTLLSAYLPVRL